jgi:hypothetical protein
VQGLEAVMLGRFVVFVLLTTVASCAPPGQQPYEVYGEEGTKGATVLLNGQSLGTFKHHSATGQSYKFEAYGPVQVDSVAVVFPDGRRISAVPEEPFEYIWVSRDEVSFSP